MDNALLEMLSMWLRLYHTVNSDTKVFSCWNFFNTYAIHGVIFMYSPLFGLKGIFQVVAHWDSTFKSSVR